MNAVVEIRDVRGVPMIGACRKKVGHTHGGDLFLLVIIRTGHRLKLKPKFGPRPWFRLPRRWFISQLGITIGKYNDAVKHLKATGLIEWEHRGGCTTAGMRLSPGGETWARAEGILLEQAASGCT